MKNFLNKHKMGIKMVIGIIILLISLYIFNISLIKHNYRSFSSVSAASVDNLKPTIETYTSSSQGIRDTDKATQSLNIRQPKIFKF